MLKAIDSCSLTLAVPRTTNVAASMLRSYDISVLSRLAYVISGPKSGSLTTVYLNVRVGARLDDKEIVTGIIRGPAPRRPAIVVARSWRNVPMISPVLASLMEEKRLGSTV